MVFRRGFTVTRDTSGEFNVFIDGTLRITVTNTAVISSTYFLVVIVDPGNYIDNIQVYDEILTDPGDDGSNNGGGLVFPPELILIIGGAVGIIVIIAVVILILRRRKSGP
jgi:hypothetical protein